MLNMQKYAQGKYDIRFRTSSICYLDCARNDLATKAFQDKPDYVLWLDADMSYPEDTPERLMKHDKLVISGLTLLKGNGLPMLFNFIGNSFDVRNAGIRTGLMKVDVASMGGLLVKTTVFEKLKFPYFNTGWSKAMYVGEDIYFYKQCKNKGIEIWCDTSLKFGHMDLIERI